MTRHWIAGTAAATALLTGCHAPQGHSSPQRASFAVDAGFAGGRGPTSGLAQGAAQALAPDSVAVQVLTAGLRCLDEQLRVTSVNVANQHTPGFKRRRVQVTPAMVEVDGARYELPVVERVDSVYTTGCIEETGRSLDVAIDGEGFFSVLLPTGLTAYTRDGCLQLDAGGQLVTSVGNVVLPQITLSPDTLDVWIDPQGLVCGRTAGAPETVTHFGQLKLHRFVNVNGLRAIGAGQLSRTDASGAPVTHAPGSGGVGVLKQGFLEYSNVDLAHELVQLQVLMKQRERLALVFERLGLVGP